MALTACATNPQAKNPQETTAAFLKEKPGSMKFDIPEAEVIFELLIAEIAAQKDMAEVSARYYVEAAKRSGDPRIASRAARVASFANLSAEALIATEIWANTEPDNLEAARILAVLLLRVDRVEDAKLQLKKLLSNDTEPVPRNILQIGSMLQREASKDSAFEISRYLIELYPQHAESHFVAASLAVGADKKDDALNYIDKSLELNATWSDAVILRSRILTDLGKNDDALAYLRKYVSEHPADNKVRLTYARMLIDTRKLEDARSQFEALAIKLPENEDVLFTLAMLSLQFKQVDEAEGYLNQLYKLGKTGPQIIYYLGQIAEQKQQTDAAMEWYSKIRGGEYFIDAQIRIAAVISRTKTIDDAIIYLHGIVPNNADEAKQIVLFEGNLLKDNKRDQEAFDLYTNALEKFPKDTEITFSRSLIAERLGKVDLAIKDLQGIVDREPDNAAALNALGYTLADQNRSLEKAMTYVKKAIEIEPSDPAIMDSLGWVYFRMGNLDEAEKYLRKAIELIKDGEVAAHLGEVLWARGQKEEAMKIWNQAREEFADNDTLRKTLERLGK